MYKKNRNIIQFAYDIEECINEVIEEVNGIEYVEFAADKKLIGYVKRQLEKIGEAITQIQKLDKNILLQSYNEISYWENIKGMRNRLIHDYWGTSIEMIYEVSLYELEELLEYIKQVRNNVINTN